MEGHLPKLIVDLALILTAGAVKTLIFRRFRQPLVLGYIIAGFLVGPYFSLIPSVIETENVKTLAEIGVIFLLFSLGLEFSFKKLMRVGGAASVTAFVEILFITVAGYFAGRWMGWSYMDSLFLGGMLASSSTTIIIRAFDELGMKTKQYARIVFGVLVVEDIVVILLMVLLSTIAVTSAFEGWEMIFTVLRLLFFLALWFIAGIFLLPTFLSKAKKLLDEETLLILSIGLCLGMVVLATRVGFSAELGAFMMGSIIAETTSAEKVEHLIKPVKDLFGAVFFVSVGMMIDPAAISQHFLPVVIVTLLTLFGKMGSTALGAIISGQPLKQSIQVGMSMAQIGEFAFIVATLGLSLGVISDFLFPVAVGASAITTFTTPYMIKYSENFYKFLIKILPEKWISALNAYSASTQHIQAESTWKGVLFRYGRIVLTNGIVVLAINLLVVKFILPFLNTTLANIELNKLIAVIVSIGISSPFIWAVMAKKPDTEGYKEMWLEKKYNRGPLLVIEIARNIIGVILVAVVVESIYSTRIAIVVAISVTAIVLFIFSKKIQQFYQRIEARFLTNLNARESATAMNAMAFIANTHSDGNKSKTGLNGLTPWDANIIDLEVNPNAEYIGKTLAKLGWREKFGINIVYIKRGETIIHAPSRHARLYPFDLAGIIATDDQMQQFKPVFDAAEKPKNEVIDVENIVLQKIVVNELNKLKGQTIRHSGIREKTNGLVVGIERNKARILNPDSSTVFEWGDIVWIVGDRKKIQKFAVTGNATEAAETKEN